MPHATKKVSRSNIKEMPRYQLLDNNLREPLRGLAVFTCAGIVGLSLFAAYSSLTSVSQQSKSVAVSSALLTAILGVLGVVAALAKNGRWGLRLAAHAGAAVGWLLWFPTAAAKRQMFERAGALAPWWTVLHVWGTGYLFTSDSSANAKTQERETATTPSKLAQTCRGSQCPRISKNAAEAVRTAPLRTKKMQNPPPQSLTTESSIRLQTPPPTPP